MKKVFSFAIYAMAAMAMALAMGSCKKENQNAKFNNTNGSAVSHFDPSHISDMNAYLGEFKQKMKQSQYAKDGETLPLEEAAWHLSSVANYDFANANVEFTDLRYDTLYYQVNVLTERWPCRTSMPYMLTWQAISTHFTRILTLRRSIFASSGQVSRKTDKSWRT